MIKRKSFGRIDCIIKKDMKEQMIELFNLRYVETTKWNDIYENTTHVFIFNRVTKEIKIKPK